jgi:hypothetical protein
MTNMEMIFVGLANLHAYANDKQDGNGNGVLGLVAARLRDLDVGYHEVEAPEGIQLPDQPPPEMLSVLNEARGHAASKRTLEAQLNVQTAAVTSQPLVQAEIARLAEGRKREQAAMAEARAKAAETGETQVVEPEVVDEDEDEPVHKRNRRR